MEDRSSSPPVGGGGGTSGAPEGTPRRDGEGGGGQGVRTRELEMTPGV